MNVAFPLRDGYFRSLHATPEDQARWKALVHELVQLSLQEERPFLESQYEAIDARKWKLVRSKDQLRVFRPRRGTTVKRSTADSQVLLEIGTIEGTLEDVIYGVHHVTSADMRTTTAFLSSDALDSAVLQVLENGVAGDPYRSFALKWRILETPAGSLVKNRDVCAFEYMGIDIDGRGERYAFHIVESFDHPACPPFHPQCAIRAKTNTRIIYRQLRPGRVGVYYRAEYTTGGKIPKLIARWTAAEVAVSIGRSIECAEAKKLTALALANATDDEDGDGRGRLATDTAHCCVVCDLRTNKALHVCHICGASVCGRCRSKKYLLSDDGKVQVECCKQCIVAVKTMPVDARQPLALVSYAHWHVNGRLLPAHGHIRAAAKSTASSISAPSMSGYETASLASRPTEGMAVWPADLQHRWTKSTELLHDDVYEVFAGMSVASESTSTSFSSRDEMVEHHSIRGEMGVATNYVENEPLWQRMQQLRLAAEQTYHLTKLNGDEWLH